MPQTNLDPVQPSGFIEKDGPNYNPHFPGNALVCYEPPETCRGFLTFSLAGLPMGYRLKGAWLQSTEIGNGGSADIWQFELHAATIDLGDLEASWASSRGHVIVGGGASPPTEIDKNLADILDVLVVDDIVTIKLADDCTGSVFRSWFPALANTQLQVAYSLPHLTTRRRAHISLSSRKSSDVEQQTRLPADADSVARSSAPVARSTRHDAQVTQSVRHTSTIEPMEG